MCALHSIIVVQAMGIAQQDAADPGVRGGSGGCGGAGLPQVWAGTMAARSQRSPSVLLPVPSMSLEPPDPTEILTQQ